MSASSARQRHQRLMQQNGLLAIFIGLVGGFVLVASLIGGISASPLPLFVSLRVPGTSSGWLSFHLGMLMNGMMALVLERTLNTRAVSRLKGATVCWGVIIAVWGNGAFYLFSMFAPNRGLTSDTNVFGPPSLFGHLAYFPAIAGAIGLMLATLLLLMAPDRPAMTDQSLDD
jgi:hypothetical protein